MDRPSKQRENEDEEYQAPDYELFNEENQEGWTPWYPCPECGSMEFEQTQIATVYASEDGEYGGEDIHDDLEKIECIECGEVLDG